MADEDTYYVRTIDAEGHETLDKYVDGELVERNTSV
jgi:hypothetical protein